MSKFYFTFGTNHCDVDGQCLADYWVEVEAEDWDKARGKFINQFTKVYMPAPDKWSFQYTEENFKEISFRFPGGKLFEIT